MKIYISALTAATLALFVAGAQAQMTGTSHPENLDDNITTIAQPPAQAVKPSPAVPVTTEPALHAHTDATPASAIDPGQSTSDHYVPSHGIATQRTLETAHNEPTFVVTSDPNSGVVINVPSAENELPEGTLLRARLDAEISTQNSTRGDAFHAQLTQPIEHRGKIVIPAGSILSGRITQLHGGHRIGGAATIYLQPEFITMPGGSTYRLDAQVIDLAHPGISHVTDEGAIVGNDHSKGTIAALGLTTASAAAAGGMIGGPVGVVVGAGVGAGVDTVWWLKHENQQTLKPGTVLILSLNSPMLLEPVSH